MMLFLWVMETNDAVLIGDGSLHEIIYISDTFISIQ